MAHTPGKGTRLRIRVRGELATDLARFNADRRAQRLLLLAELGLCAEGRGETERITERTSTPPGAVEMPASADEEQESMSWIRRIDLGKHKR